MMMIQLKLVHQITKITTYLTGAGIEVLSIKGPVLGFQLHHNTATRQSNDIDLLIKPLDVERTMKILEDKGYRSMESVNVAELNPHYLNSFLKLIDEVTLISISDPHIKIDLHWRLTTPHELLQIEKMGLWASKEECNFNNHRIDVPDKNINFLYLCLHGAKHSWFRLQWLLDINDIITSSHHVLDWNWVRQKAISEKITRPVVQSLKLCELLFGTKMPDWSLKVYKKDKSSQKLVVIAMKAIIESAEKMNAFNLYNILRLNINLLYLKPTFSYKWACLQRVLISPKDWIVIKLPPQFFLLYIPLRPILFLLRKLK